MTTSLIQLLITVVKGPGKNSHAYFLECSKYVCHCWHLSRIRRYPLLTLVKEVLQKIYAEKGVIAGPDDIVEHGEKRSASDHMFLRYSRNTKTVK